MLIKRLFPPFKPCVNCGHEYSGAVCPVCKAEHPALTAIKNIGRDVEKAKQLSFAAHLARMVC
jgi:hypothetical protein